MAITRSAAQAGAAIVMLSVAIQKRRGNFTLDINFSVASNSVIALFGPSGCGKSTVINMIAGLLDADRGVIKLGDTVLFDSTQRTNIAGEHRAIGYVFQEPRLFPHYNVNGNLRYGLQRAHARTQAIAFDTVVDLLGLNQLLTRRIQQLSGGERQRVAIGRALLSQPKLLLLDEPLASLDMARREEVLPYLERLRDFMKIPMVYVSHQFEEVLRLASHVVLMNRGQCLAQGDLQTISLQPELRTLLGADAIGAVVEGEITAIDQKNRLAQIRIGRGQVSVDAQELNIGQRVRLQLLARDLVLALNAPTGLSIRNQLQGVVTQLTPDNHHATLVEIDLGGVTAMARITNSAVHEMNLHVGLSIWVLVKAVTLRGHLYTATTT